MTTKFFQVPGLLLAIGIVSCILQADDKPAQKVSGWQRLFRKQAAAYKVVVEGDAGGNAVLVAEPILKWSQPVRGGDDGAVFVWTLEGRPVVIGTMFIYPKQDGTQGVVHEMHSLSQSPLTANWRDRRWIPPQDSLVFKPIPNASVPAATGEQRLRQMRELSRQFTSESHDENGRRWDLRLLASPLFRYTLEHKEETASGDGEVLDGALFGFVEGTDLEIVLAIQARKTPAGYRWEFALARMSDHRLLAKLANETVWEVDRSVLNDARAAYYCSEVESRKSADEEKE